MKTINKIALLFLCSTICCVAGMGGGGGGGGGGKKGRPGDDGPPDTHSLVASVTPGSPAGTGMIAINGDDPFKVTPDTTIIVDGKNAKLTDVKTGMLVLTHTAADSSMPEIDLKSEPATPAAKKGKTQTAQN